MMRALGAIEVAMKRVMEYCVSTPDRGLYLKPTGNWNGRDKDFQFKIHGMSDSDYAKDPETRRSVSGYATFLNDAPVTMKSKMQECVTLSVTEAELVAATNCAQDMLYIKKVLNSLGLRVELPMILYVDNKGAKDLMNNWSVGGRTRHVEVRYHFLRELKERNIIRINWVSTHENCADLFTKNLQGPIFKKHVQVFCGKDCYGNCEPEVSQGEGVRNEYDSISTSDDVKYNSKDSTSKTGTMENTTQDRLIKRRNFKIGRKKKSKEVEDNHSLSSND